LTREIYRKLVHVSTVLVPLLAWVLPRGPMLVLLGVAVIVAASVEWGRARIPWVRYRFLRRTRTVLRPHERRGLAGATYLALAYLLALLIFPRPIAVAAMLYAGLGDATAALVGKRWGRNRTRWGKSWEGAAAMLAVCVAVGLAIPGVPAAAAIAGGLAGTTLEFLPLPLDDNLRVTLGGGAVAWLIAALAA
jgi:dolichol kinase